MSLFALIGLVFALNAIARCDDETKPTKKTGGPTLALDGTWRVTGFRIDGSDLPQESLKEMTWIIKDNEITFVLGDEVPSDRAKLKYDSRKTPMEMELISVEGPRKGKIIQGIIRTEKDRITMCVNEGKGKDEPRPSEFKADKGSGFALITLERKGK